MATGAVTSEDRARTRDGRELYLEAHGSGAPTVVFEAGARASRHGGPRRIQYALNSEARVCTYDRPGTDYGASDPRPANVAPTSATFARELKTLLTNANVPGPYLLVGGSFGGLLISAFTAWYPNDVAGLVYIDAFAPGSAESYVRINPTEGWEPSGDLAKLQALNFGARPVVALATVTVGDTADLRRRSPNILVAQAPQYGHNVWGEVPGLAYEAIRVALKAVRDGGPVPRCIQTPLARLVFSCTP